VELLGEVHGSGYKEGAALVRRADGQMVQLGPLQYALLEAVDGRRSAPELAAAMTERVGRKLEPAHVERLADKLGGLGLLAGTEDNAPPKINPLLALRWKVLVTNPAVTRRLTAPFTVLFRPWLLWPILAAFAGVCWFVLVEKGVASATADAFGNPELLLLVFLLAVASAGFHEMGHAAACRYGGGTPSGMGMGIYLVWPAFYTDVTDAYRLPKRDRLRTDLGGLYFNAVVAVVTLAVWLAVRVDALLLLVALQLIEMVKQLSPVIRADGYHILSDLTGVPDLYAHIGPTLKGLLPWRREPPALTGRARVIVTLWVLVVVPVLLSLAVSAVLLLPRLAATAWESGRTIATGIPDAAGDGRVLDVLTGALQLFALVLPVLGGALVARRLATMVVGSARRWSEGEPVRRGVVMVAAAAMLAGAAWAWWPAGQYRPVRANENGTVSGLVGLVSSPSSAALAAGEVDPNPVRVAPGKHVAISMIPVGGATEKHPAMFVIKGEDGEPSVAIVSPQSPDPAQAPSAPGAQTASAGSTSAPPAPTATPAGSDGAQTTTVPATAFPFKLPDEPGPGDTQALAVNTKDGAVLYDVAYALVTVRDGDAVHNTNSAFALASCKSCTTVAVSFQVVLVIGQSNVISPINAAGALNVNCPACITTALAHQIIVTLSAEPSPELLAALQSELERLDAVGALGDTGTADQVVSIVNTIHHDISATLDASGLLNSPSSSSTSTTPAGTTTSSTPSTTSTTTTPAAPPPATSTTESAPPPTSTTEAEPAPAETTTTETTTTSTTETAPPDPEPAPSGGTATTTTP
jgi:putative peptide zinc metalloprotease protein